MVIVSECRPLSLQIVGNSDSQPKSGSIGAEDTIYISVSTLRCTTQFIHDTLLTTDYSIQRVLYTYYNHTNFLTAKKINLIEDKGQHIIHQTCSSVFKYMRVS